ncbi:MFS transporter [Fangia hongkongensis]|uniref:MFS transporter n=1 Tax=Fangia hongkongensis TaxID=270495 RepID=UPI000370B30E|nr:MFS transporter [Fangia hongkongensis]MBK2125244.1 MFS transporter [Fangia hongkongensis]
MQKMQDKLKPNFAMLFAPIISMCILTVGNTFYMTYTTLELEKMGQANWVIGLVSAAYFTGMMLGSYFTQKLIVRIGYIRGYVLFATMMALGAMLQGIFYAPILWGAFRFICGYALAGLFIVVESWCLEGAGSAYKGRVLSIYLLLYYFVQASGQYLLNIDFGSVLLAFCVISMFASLSIIPVSLTKFEMPRQERVELLSPWVIFKRAPLGIWASFVAGVILGSIYTIYPLFLKQVNYPADTISTMMFAIIIGGMLLQIPIGKLSDIMDRRKVLLFMLIGATVVSVLVCLIHNSFYEMILLSFILGGLTFTIYPISISHTSDYLDPDQLVGVIGLLALAYGVGSMFGPVLATSFMSIFGSFGFFIFVAIMCIALILYTLWRFSVRVTPAAEDDKVQFQQMAPESSAASEALVEQQLIDDKNDS